MQVTSTSGRKRKQDDAEMEIMPKRAASSASGEEAELQEHIHELQEIHGDKLQSQYFKQLKEIQNLRDENVLNVDEFQAEKDA